jgi:CRISPR system Cascade subunit CasA
VIGEQQQAPYTGFRKEKFNFSVEGLWPHPHGVQIWNKTKKEWKFVSFTTTAPAWTLLTEFVVPRSVSEANASEGCTPAGPAVQASEIFHEEPLYLLVGGYRTKQASVLERRHELFTLAAGWDADGKDRLKRLVDVGRLAKTALRGKLYFAAQGNKDRGMKGIGVAIHETGEKLYYAQTEALFHETLREEMTFKDWKHARMIFTQQITRACQAIFERLTEPYSHKPELIPIIAWARRSLNTDLAKLTETIKA